MDNRREVKARQTKWAAAMARFLIRCRISPNAISVSSVLFALIASGALFAAYRSSAVRPLYFLLAMAAVVLRLLCNLFDGMVAVEGGFKTPAGAVFNDLPDRIADLLILVVAGYAVQARPHGILLGWMAGTGALFTAYVRMLGGACGMPQDFTGPMAKQQRMALVLLALALSLIVCKQPVCASWIMWGALFLIAIGCLFTIARRVARIVGRLNRNEMD